MNKIEKFAAFYDTESCLFINVCSVSIRLIQEDLFCRIRTKTVNTSTRTHAQTLRDR